VIQIRLIYSILLLLLLVPVSQAGCPTLEEAQRVSDTHVIKYGVFHHQSFLLNSIRLFRKVHSVEEDSISFLYLAVQKIGDKEMKGEFIVTVGWPELEVVSVNVLTKNKLPAPTPY